MGRSNSEWHKIEQEILRKLDIAAEAEALGIKFSAAAPNAKGLRACHSAMRGEDDDANPSAFINVAGANGKLGYYKDSGSGEKPMSFWQLAALKGGFSDWKAARQHYADKVGVDVSGGVKRSRPATLKETLDRQYVIHSPNLNQHFAAEWSKHKTGVTADAIMSVCGFRAANWLKKLDVLLFPAYGPADGWTKIRGIVKYRKDGELFPAYKKRPARKVLNVLNSTDGIVIVGTLEQAKLAGKAYLCEGLPDALAITPHLPADGSSIAVSTLCGADAFADDLIDFFADKEVVIIHDADKSGKTGSEIKAGKIARVAKSVRNIHLHPDPYRFTEDHGKDVRDFFNDGFSFAKLLELIDKTEVATPADDGPPVIAEADDDPHRLARAFLARYQYGDLSTLRYWRSEWWQWRSKNYERLAGEEVPSLLTFSIKKEFDRLYLEQARLPRTDDERPPQSIKVTRARVNDSLNALKSLCLTPGSTEMPQWLGDEPGGKNCISMANGILDLDLLMAGSSKCLSPHTPQWFSSVCLPYDFDPGAQCPKWLEFLNRVMESDFERIALLQEWAGYLIFQDTSQQKFLALEGDGANGKSVYLAALTAMLGNDSVSHISLERFSDRFALTDSVGKLANIVADVGEIDKVSEGHLKSFTSGDPMFFDRKGIPGFTAVPTARLIISFNNRPRFSDRSSGIWRRMLLIPFMVTIPDDEKVRHMDEVPWWIRSGELPGILNWAIDGLCRLRKKGRFTESKISKSATEDYQLESNPAKAFLLDHYGEFEGCHVSTKEVYQKYREWCRESGCHPLGDRAFGKEVKRIFQKTEKKKFQEDSKREWHYFYLGILQSGF